MVVTGKDDDSDTEFQQSSKSHLLGRSRKYTESSFIDETVRDYGASTGSSYKKLTKQTSVVSHSNYGLSFSAAENKLDEITLSWHDVDVQAPPTNVQPEKVHILKKVSGIARPGTLLAVMGASGAGKTTLMNVLTYRHHGSTLEISGDVRVNGRIIGKEITNLSAYVQQEDLFIGALTVKEQLWFQATLRMRQDITSVEKDRKIQQALDEFGLIKCADTLIGTPGRIKGISGGEKKRLAFAAEVLTNPSLFYCDEPTSGLDSFMAESVIKVLKKMAMKGKTILCTIHQPSSEVFRLFDRYMFMASGRVAFCGGYDESLKFFETQGLPCPANFNPADHFIHSLAIMPGKYTQQCKERVEALCDTYSRSEACEREQHDLDELKRVGNASDFCLIQQTLDTRKKYKASSFTQFYCLLWRSWLQVVRDSFAIKMRFIQSGILSVIVAMLYLSTDRDKEYDDVDVMNINGVIFLSLIQQSFPYMSSVLQVFPLEYPIFRHEYDGGMYRSDMYFFSKTFAELPGYTVCPIMYAVIVYWLTGLKDDVGVFFIYIGVMVLTANTAVSFGYIISTFANTVSMAMAAGPPFMVTIMLFGGFFINTDTIPVWLGWLKWLSWVLYGNEILLINQWSDVGLIGNSTDTNTNQTLPSKYRDGKDVLDSFKFDELNYTRDILAMVGLLFGFRLLAYFILFIKVRLVQK